MRNFIDLIAFALTVQIAAANSSVVMCYWGTWSVNNPGNGTFTAADIDATACTHVAYAFFGVDSSADVTILDPTLDIEEGNIANFTALKSKNSDLKLMASIGGWTQGSVNFSNIAGDAELRAIFVQNVVDLLTKYGFDGCDIDWEFPAQRGGVEDDYVNYIILLQDLKAAFETNGYILTSAVSAVNSYIEISYNVTALNEVLDYIFLMTYDFYIADSPVTGVNAPLYAQRTDAANSTLNVDSAVKNWIANGASPSKLVLGLGLYGHTYTLANSANASTGAAVTGPGVAGPYSAESGMWTYLEICEAQKNEPDSWNITNVDNNYVYANDGDFWVGYDVADTMYKKGAYAKSMGLAGIMFWSIDYEDFRGSCGEKNILIYAAKNGYDSS